MAEILVVDDDDDVAYVIQAFLEMEHHRVRRAADGEKGLASLDDEGLPDLVVMDVEMPLLSGPGMAAQMRAQDLGKERIPLIVVSGVVGLEEVAEHMGTPYYLPKPFAPEALSRLVARALRERRWPTPQIEAHP